MFFVYLLRCCDGSIYIGYTKNIERRIAQHNAGQVSWTRSRLPASLIYRELFSTREKAVAREEMLKSGFGRKWIKKRFKENHSAARQAGDVEGPSTNADQ